MANKTKSTKNETPFILNAFDLSEEEMRYIKNKYPAFAARIPTTKAKEQDVYVNDNYGTSYAVSRSAVPGYSDYVRYVDYVSTRHWYYADSNRAASWVAFHHIYNPESSFVRSAKKVKRTASVWMPDDESADKFKYTDEGKMQEVTSEGYVSTFGGKEYLIVNYEEAKAAYEKDGTMLPMLCAEVDSHECAVPFSRKNNNDYSKATEHHEQYERILFENATEEEKQYIVPTEFICEMKEGTPCYDKSVARVDLMKDRVVKENSIISKMITALDDLKSGNITISKEEKKRLIACLANTISELSK